LPCPMVLLRGAVDSESRCCRGIAKGERVSVLEGRCFPEFKEGDRGVILGLNLDSQVCSVKFDQRSSPVEVPLRHLRSQPEDGEACRTDAPDVEAAPDSLAPAVAALKEMLLLVSPRGAGEASKTKCGSDASTPCKKVRNAAATPPSGSTRAASSAYVTPVQAKDHGDDLWKASGFSGSPVRPVPSPIDTVWRNHQLSPAHGCGYQVGHCSPLAHGPVMANEACYRYVHRQAQPPASHVPRHSQLPASQVPGYAAPVMPGPLFSQAFLLQEPMSLPMCGMAPLSANVWHAPAAGAVERHPGLLPPVNLLDTISIHPLA